MRKRSPENWTPIFFLKYEESKLKKTQIFLTFLLAVFLSVAAIVRPAYARGDEQFKVPSDKWYQFVAQGACALGWMEILKQRYGLEISKLKENVENEELMEYRVVSLEKGRYVEDLGWTVRVECLVRTKKPFVATPILPPMKASANFKATMGFRIKDDGFEQEPVATRFRLDFHEGDFKIVKAK